MDANVSKNDYIRKVLDAYRRMPDTAGAVRRIFRSPDAPTLQPVRSLHYLLPVIDEVLAAHVSPDYYRYLQFKIDQTLNRKQTL